MTILPVTQDFIARFWARVDKTGPNGCWSWTGSNNGAADKRGKVHLGYVGGYRSRKRSQAYAYVVAWALTHGEVPEGLKVCHKCDNGNCVNPDHLFIGTQHDNILDMHAKGRADSFGQKKELASGIRINRRKRERLQAA